MQKSNSKMQFFDSSTFNESEWRIVTKSKYANNLKPKKNITVSSSASVALGLTTHEEAPPGALGGDVLLPEGKGHRREPIFRKVKHLTVPTIPANPANTPASGSPAPPAPANPANIPALFHYFITIAFPTNNKYTIKHLELSTRPRIVFKPIKYGDCTQQEQYTWLMHKLQKNIQHIADSYDIFFEQTKEGNLHMHGRLKYDEKKMTMKDLKSLIHRIFETSTHFSRFVDIKVYEHTKWSDYDTKIKKDYQTLNYPHFKNI